MKWTKRRAAQIQFHCCVLLLAIIRLAHKMCRQTKIRKLFWMDQFNRQMYVYQNHYHWRISFIKHGMQAWKISIWIVLAPSAIERPYRWFHDITNTLITLWCKKYIWRGSGRGGEKESKNIPPVNRFILFWKISIHAPCNLNHQKNLCLFILFTQFWDPILWYHVFFFQDKNEVIRIVIPPICRNEVHYSAFQFLVMMLKFFLS